MAAPTNREQHAHAVLHQNKDISEAGKGDRCGGRDLGQGKQQERVQRRAAEQLSISCPSGEALQLRSGWCCVGGRPGLKNLPSVLAEGCRAIAVEGHPRPNGVERVPPPGARTSSAAPVLQISERKHVH